LAAGRRVALLTDTDALPRIKPKHLRESIVIVGPEDESDFKSHVWF
jgi:hypothetical protein